MPSLRSWLQSFRRFFRRAVVARRTSNRLEIAKDDERRLVILGRRGPLVVDRRFKTVSRGERVLARFDAIRSVDIRRFSNRRGFVRCRLSLHLGWWSRIEVGHTGDDAQASIIAARLGSYTGKKVLSL